MRLLKNEGFIALNYKVLQKLENRQKKQPKIKKVNFSFLAKESDVIKADWTKISTNDVKNAPIEPPYTINWVMSPPGKGSGGHQNIFRFINYLESMGHTCRIYLYSATIHPSVQQVKVVLKDSYPKTNAKISWYNGSMAVSDAVFATGWETAYPVLNDGSKAKRFYFVQDFEPLFYPVGSEYILAENTYRFNFFGITAGNWLATKLKQDYGMQTQHYDFGSEDELYGYKNSNKRKEIFFYARPVTARRGFELGIMALEIVAKELPDYTITLAGWDVSNYDIPFGYQNLKTLPLEALSDVYNNCAAALVVSLTNMSLLPLELLACGTIPIVNKGQNNEMVSSNPYIHYADPSPAALAEAIINTVQRKDIVEYGKKASQSVKSSSWSKAGEIVEKTLIKELTNG
ncbi:glycosyltransferase family 1 protein [bacterium]|nr:glycosyltransferase family 1 protein [bacterium]NBX98001.1 glycosyltransferase family 1 protein [bacterium]NDC95188.1 glycosyltransferase family 1 protein [bacterium]NDD84956.1 glycosyltransferase family 1 protein [bacterium]